MRQFVVCLFAGMFLLFPFAKRTKQKVPQARDFKHFVIEGSFSPDVVFALQCPSLKINISQARIYMLDLSVDLRRHAVQDHVMAVFIFAYIEEDIAVIGSALAEQVTRFYILVRDCLTGLICHAVRIELDRLLVVILKYPYCKSRTVTLLFCLPAKLIRPGRCDTVKNVLRGAFML